MTTTQHALACLAVSAAVIATIANLTSPRVQAHSDYSREMVKIVAAQERQAKALEQLVQEIKTRRAKHIVSDGKGYHEVP